MWHAGGLRPGDRVAIKLPDGIDWVVCFLGTIWAGGVATLLDALDADRELFDAERSLAQSRRDELLSVVQLYRALGGGWQ